MIISQSPGFLFDDGGGGGNDGKISLEAIDWLFKI